MPRYFPDQPSSFTSLPDYRPRGPYTKNVIDAGWISDTAPQSENVLVYVDNHDGMSRPLDFHYGNIYSQSLLFMLFHPWGTAAQVMSSYWTPSTDSINKFAPPLVPLTPEQANRSRTDYLINLTRQVSSVRCRVAPRSIMSEDDKAWQAGVCLDGNGTGCEWICQHRWPGIAALTRARKLVGKELMVEQVWTNAEYDRFAFGVGGTSWVYMHNVSSPEGKLELLLNPLPKTTGMPAGSYCNLAQLPEKFVSSLSNWAASPGRAFCSDPESKLRVEVNSAGFVVGGTAPAGFLNGIVVIHKDFPASLAASESTISV